MMKRSYGAFLLLLTALVAAPLAAQDADRGGYDKALGFGAGVVDAGSGNAEYFTANFRFRIVGPEADGGGSAEGMKGFLEVEAAAWDEDDDILDSDIEDFLIGLNLLGVVPFRYVDFFFGGGLGVHFLDVTFRDNDFGDLDDSEDVFGVNFQTGIDVHVSNRLAIFVLARLDLLEDGPTARQDFELFDDNQSKIVLGLRFKFD